VSLTRFHDAQRGVWEGALAELRAGTKRGHWMWFVLPQIAGLGRSGTARYYAIADLTEARAYLADPVLGPRLIRAADALLAAPGSAETILGPIDAVKLRSCATLFEAAAGDRATRAAADDADEARPFTALLDRFFGGERDPETLARL